MPNYTSLHTETLQVILQMHVKHQVQLLADPEAKHHTLISLKKTIALVREALSGKELRMKN